MAADDYYSHYTSSLKATVTFYRNIVILLTYTLIVALTLSPFNPFKDPFESIRQIGNDYFVVAAIFGAFVIFVLKRPTRTLLWRIITFGVCIGAGMKLWRHQVDLSLLEVTLCLVTGLGASSILGLCFEALRAKGVQRLEFLSILYPSVIVPLFVVQSIFYLGLTSLLHPLTLDRFVYAVDWTFGTQLSFESGKLLQAIPVLRSVCVVVYMFLPASLAAVYAFESNQTRDSSRTVMTSFIVAAVCGYVLYHFYPVVGPVYAFGESYPSRAPLLSDLQMVPIMVVPVDRNCMPALHFSWALLQWWHSRSLARWIQYTAFVWLIITVLATLGLGLHYLIDLIVAVPFSVAVRGIASLLDRKHESASKRSVFWGGLMTIGWLAILRIDVGFLIALPGLVWALSIGTISFSMLLEKRLREAERAPLPQPLKMDLAQPDVRNETAAPPTFWGMYSVGAVFVFSGFSGLVYEVVFAKCLALTFGSMATASTTVLATYMGGIALGSWIGGRIGAARANALQIYAFCEIGIGVLCALSPVTWVAIQKIYVFLATGAHPSSPVLTALQIVLGSLGLLPPTILMGITLPVLARKLIDLNESLGRSVGLLYGSNTFGAALGAIITGYVLLPAFGVIHTTLLAVALNFAAALMGLQLQKRLTPTVSLPAPAAAMNEAQESGEFREGLVAIIILFVGGILTLALEIVYIHLLAIVVGNSAYAFSLMLFTFLIGLSLGSVAARNLVRIGVSVPLSLGVAEFLLAIALLAGVFMWRQIPGYFASFDGYPLVNTFTAREIVRGIVSFLVMVPPTLCIGAYYPLAMELVGKSFPLKKIAALGWAAALNTVGNIIGVLIGAFVLLPFFGSLRSLQALAASALCLGLVIFAVLRAPKRIFAGVFAVAITALFLVQPKDLDYQSLSSGAQIYFMSQGWGKIIDHSESMDGGLTSIAESQDNKGHRVLTMLTNGKFQGNDNPIRAMAAQSYALCPMLHTTYRNKAAVIGLGTGVSAKTIHDAGFKHMDVVELSADVLDMARRYFSHVNNLVIDRSGVNTHVTDGRNFMLLQPVQYDLISMEISSIWFAGAANLYNREFYRLAKSRLTKEGVFQQWIPLHHITPKDVLSVIATVRSEFRYVWLYFIAYQGIIVASDSAMMPSAGTISALDSEEGLKEALSHYGGSSRLLLRERLLDPISVDEMLKAGEENGIITDEIISTDNNLFLEYSTPKGNVYSYWASLKTNLTLLKRFAPPSVARGTHLTDESVGGPASTGIPLPQPSSQEAVK
ncbi:MAG: fused MFS/spermidine synthase [Desulfomonilaceae bacterium]